MFNKFFLAAAIAITGMMFMGESEAEAQNCYRGGGGYGYAPAYRSSYRGGFAARPVVSSYRGGGFGYGYGGVGRSSIGYGGFGSRGIGYGYPGFYGRGTSFGFSTGGYGRGVSFGFGN